MKIEHIKIETNSENYMLINIIRHLLHEISDICDVNHHKTKNIQTRSNNSYTEIHTTYKNKENKHIFPNINEIENSHIMFTKFVKVFNKITNHKILLKRDMFIHNDINKFYKLLHKSLNPIFLGRLYGYNLAQLFSYIYIQRTSKFASHNYLGEMKHGPLALIDNNSLVVVIDIFESNVKAITQSNIMEVLSRGSRVVLMSNKKYTLNHKKFVNLILDTKCEKTYIYIILQLINNFYISRYK